MVEVFSHQHMTSEPEEFTATAETLVSILRSRANRNPDRRVFTFLERGEREQASLTFGGLDRRARAIANRLTSLQAKGERVVLLYPPGLEFIASFFGCLYAGAIAVPGYPPTRGHNHSRLLALIRDAGAKFVLTVSDSVNALQHLLGDLIRDRAVTLLASDQVADAEAIGWAPIEIGRDAVAYIQYTSGSTSTPRGVRVRHGNLMHNQCMIGRAFGLSEGLNLVSWLPLFHDMGLVGIVEHAVYGGLNAVLMSPLEFIHRPIRWLRAISRYNAHTSGGPNFGYDLCVKRIKPDDLTGLDLSCWKVAFNGSEPVRAETMERFAAKFSNCGFKSSSFFPCYGLAEATLFVSGRVATGTPVVRTVNSAALEAGRFEESPVESSGSRRIVSCGKGEADQQIRIVDPQTGTICPAGTVGEIWVSGSHIAQGYWGRAEESANVFQARLADTGEGPFLRTGDLGCLVDGELFVTGRLKDLIIICGRNHYPHDIEGTVAASHSALAGSCNAAFVVEVDGQEEALVVVQEVRRSTSPAQAKEICAAIRQALSENHAINPHRLVLVDANTIPKTSSGKIRRFACRAAFVDGTLPVFKSRQSASEAALPTSVVNPMSISTNVVERYQAALDFERFLGDPTQSRSVLSHERALELDESETYPAQELAQLESWGLQRFYVPARLGGRFRDYEELAALVRNLGRRDCAASLAHLMSLSAGSIIWLAGSAGQQEKMAGLIEEGERLAIILHEKDHGSDLLACEVEARSAPAGFQVNGEKWVVGNARRARAMVVFVKTGEAGPKGFSLIFVDKRELDPAQFEELGPYKTHGVRSHEVAGIRFNDCAVSAASLIGCEGKGLELVLICSQITRVIATSVCLGATDTALRLVTGFAQQRRLYGQTVFELPYPRRALVRAFVDLLLSDCMTLAATRALHVLPRQASVFAAAVKSLVPALLERTVGDLSEVLGARFFVREGHPWAIFQKILRDLPIVRLAHFGTTISRSHLAGQLHSLVKHRRNETRAGAKDLDEQFGQLFDLESSLPEFEMSALELSSKGRDDMIRGLHHGLDRLRDDADELAQALVARLEILVGHLQQLDQGVQALWDHDPRTFGRSAKLFDFATSYALLHAAAACVQLWIHNRKSLGTFFAQGDWLVFALDRLLQQLGLFHLLPVTSENSFEQQIAEELLKRYAEGRSFGVLPIALYGRLNA